VCILAHMNTSTYQRVNISLPSETLRRIDRAVERGDRSRFIAAAVNLYLTKHSRKQLHKALKEGAVANAKRDLEIAKEWDAISASWENL